MLRGYRTRKVQCGYFAEKCDLDPNFQLLTYCKTPGSYLYNGSSTLHRYELVKTLGDFPDAIRVLKSAGMRGTNPWVKQ